MSNEASIRAGGASVEITAAQAGVSTQQSQRKFLDELSSFGKAASFVVDRSMDPVNKAFQRSGEKAADGFAASMAKSFGRQSTFWRVAKALRGTGPLIGLSIAAYEIAAIPAAIAKITEELDRTDHSAQTVITRQLESIPIIGTIHSAVLSVGEALSGWGISIKDANDQLNLVNANSDKIRALWGSFTPQNALQERIRSESQMAGLNWDPNAPGRSYSMQQNIPAASALRFAQEQLRKDRAEVEFANKHPLFDDTVSSLPFVRMFAHSSGRDTDAVRDEIKLLEAQETAAKQRIGAVEKFWNPVVSATGTFNPFTVQGLGGGNDIGTNIAKMQQDIAAIRAQSMSGQPNNFHP